MTDITTLRRWHEQLEEAELATEEFNERLVAKLRACPKGTLIRYLIDFAYEDVCDEFTNEILDEWEAEQEGD